MLHQLGGKSGTGNLLHHYKKMFPDDYMHLRLLIANLDFLHKPYYIKKFHKSYKGITKIENPQTYEITSGGLWQLRKWKLI